MGTQSFQVEVLHPISNVQVSSSEWGSFAIVSRNSWPNRPERDYLTLVLFFEAFLTGRPHPIGAYLALPSFTNW